MQKITVNRNTVIDTSDVYYDLRDSTYFITLLVPKHRAGATIRIENNTDHAVLINPINVTLLSNTLIDVIPIIDPNDVVTYTQASDVASGEYDAEAQAKVDHITITQDLDLDSIKATQVLQATGITDVTDAINALSASYDTHTHSSIIASNDTHAYQIWVDTDTAYDAITTKDDYTLYFAKITEEE